MNIHVPTDHVQVASQFAGSATTTGASVDAYGFTAALVSTIATTGAASKIVVKLQESEDDITFTDVDKATFEIGASKDHAIATLNVNLKQRSRYLKTVNTVTGTVVAGTTITLFNPSFSKPANTPTPVSV